MSEVRDHRAGASSRAAAEPAPNLARVPLGDLAHAKPPRADYVVADLLPRALVLLGGHGGAGKSLLALIIAAHVAAGVPFCGRSVRRGRVVFVSLEDPGELVRYRLRKIVEAYGLDAEAVTQNLVILDGSAGNPVLAAEFGDFGPRTILPTDALDEVRDAAIGAALVIVDNASDAFDGSENDRRQVRAFMRLLAKLGRETGAAVLLIAHIDKQAAKGFGNGQNYSGSTAWHNSSRGRHVVLPSGQGVEMRMEKNNLGPLAPPLFFRWADDGVLMPAEAVDCLAASNTETASDNAAVMDAFASAADVRVNVPVARTGSHTAFHALQTMPEFPGWARQGREGKDRFWAAVTRLERIGWIQAEDYRTGDRKSRRRYVIGDAAPDEAKRARQWARRNVGPSA